MIKKIIATLLALFAAVAFAAAAAAVDANKGSVAELQTVKGIGPAIAAKIVDERKNGPYKDWKDMVDRVKGVGEGNAAKLSTGGLTVNGAAFAGAPADKAEASAKKEEKAAKADLGKAAAPAGAAASTAAVDAQAAAKSAKEDKKAAKLAAKDEAKKAKADAKSAAAAASMPAKK
jgi:competence protein ComEA